MRIHPGTPYPLGATYDGAGTNFSVFSEVAERVELCLFDEAGTETRVDLPEVDRLLLARLPARRRARASATATACTGRGTRSTGSAATRPSCCSIPYAKAVEGEVHWDEAVFAYHFDDPDGRATTPTARRSCRKSRGHQPVLRLGQRPAARARRWHETVIYEVARQGLHRSGIPAMPEELRGTYAGLAHPAGDRAPARRSASPRSSCCRCTSSSTTRTCSSAGLRNYWGYNSIGFFAPHNEYAAAAQPRRSRCSEFKEMVKALHAAGIEVILDVVYNHTAEGNHLGPMLSLQGHRQRRLLPAGAGRPALLHGLHRHRQQPEHAPPARAAADHGLACATGCRRCTSTASASTSPSTLARELHDVDRLSRVLRHHPAGPGDLQVKLIAEPWDVGEGGYQVGNFPPLWSEWNGKYRDAVRDYWRGDRPDARRVRLPPHRQLATSTQTTAAGRTPASTSSPPTTASRCATSSPTTRSTTRPTARTTATATSDNRSWNCGVEGPTDDPEIIALRARQQRNFLATLFLSQGVPMLLGGDEIGRTQSGNNNAYCQDNEISWFDWEHADDEPARVHAPADRASAASTRSSGAAAGSRAAPIRGARRQRHRLVQARRRADDRRGLAARLRQVASACSSTARPSPASTTRGEPVVDDSFYAALQRRPRGAGRADPGAPHWGPALAAGARHGTAADARRGRGVRPRRHGAGRGADGRGAAAAGVTSCGGRRSRRGRRARRRSIRPGSARLPCHPCHP